MGIGREWGVKWRMELGMMARINSVSETTTVESMVCILTSKTNKKFYNDQKEISQKLYLSTL